MRACSCKDSEGFFPLTLPANNKVTQAIFLAIPSAWRVTHPHTGGVVSGPQVYARSSQIPCLVAPAFSFDSLTPAAVKKSAYGHQDSCPWRGNCFGCFLASQGPLPTLILGLCSSPWVPAIIHCMELLHMREGGKIGNTPRTSSPAEYGIVEGGNNIHCCSYFCLGSLEKWPKSILNVL